MWKAGHGFYGADCALGPWKLAGSHIVFWCQQNVWRGLFCPSLPLCGDSVLQSQRKECIQRRESQGTRCPFAGWFSKQKCMLRQSHDMQTQDGTLLMNWYFRHLTNKRKITCLCHLSGGNFYSKSLISNHRSVSPSPGYHGTIAWGWILSCITQRLTQESTSFFFLFFRALQVLSCWQFGSLGGHLLQMQGILIKRLSSVCKLQVSPSLRWLLRLLRNWLYRVQLWQQAVPGARFFSPGNTEREWQEEHGQQTLSFSVASQGMGHLIPGTNGFTASHAFPHSLWSARGSVHCTRQSSPTVTRHNRIQGKRMGWEADSLHGDLSAPKQKTVTSYWLCIVKIAVGFTFCQWRTRYITRKHIKAKNQLLPMTHWPSVKNQAWEKLWIKIVIRLAVVSIEKYTNKYVQFSLLVYDKTLGKKPCREEGLIYIHSLKGYSASWWGRRRAGVRGSSTPSPQLGSREWGMPQPVWVSCVVLTKSGSFSQWLAIERLPHPAKLTTLTIVGKYLKLHEMT